MLQQNICILFCTPECHSLYDEQKLSTEDRIRLQKTPTLANRKDWQSSRYLKQQLAGQCSSWSLSHKNAYAALVATTLPAVSLGIDLEYMQNRDFAALASLCCTVTEQQWLQRQPCHKTAFYQLWTLKESLIKLHHGQLADMKQWCLVSCADGTIELPATTMPLRAYSATIASDWLISLIYPTTLPPADITHCHGFGGWHNIHLDWHGWPSRHNV